MGFQQPYWRRNPCSIGWAIGRAFHSRRDETYAHATTKNDLARKLTGIPSIDVCCDFSGNLCKWTLDMVGLVPVIECGWPDAVSIPDPAEYYARRGHFPRRIFDVGLVDQRKRVVGAFEVVFSRDLDVAKTRDFVENGLFCIVVRAHESNLSGSVIEASDIVLKRPGCNRLRLQSYNDLPTREVPRV